MPTQMILLEAQEHFEKAIQHVHKEFSQIQAGRANPAMVEGIQIEAYGALSPLKNNASISAPEAQQLAIQAYDRSLLSAIEKAIRNSELGLNPLNDGTGIIRINIPALTEERRRNLVKIVYAKSEEAKVAVRQGRQDALHHIRALQGISEDVIKQAEEELQKLVQDANKEIDEITKNKETDVMKV